MGIFWSSQRTEYSDGLGFASQVERSEDISQSREKLEQLLRASINNYRPGSVAAPLVAAYYLGADSQTLTVLFETWISDFCEVWPEDDPVADSIGQDNIEEFYGDGRYELRYYEYFRDCLTEVTNWDQMVKMHMKQLWDRLANDDLTPLIELSAALEADNGMIAAAASTIACTRNQSSIIVDKTTVVNTKVVEGEHLSAQFRRMAKRTLESKNYECAVMVHACAEVFLSPRMRLMALGQELPILDAVEKKSSTTKNGNMPTVTPEGALKTKKANLIVYTRSRLVLQKLAI